MDDTQNQQSNYQEGGDYATPYNVDLFSPKPKNFFTEYTRRILVLPEPVKNILMDSSTAEFIEEILGPEFNMAAEQKAEITRIIRDVLLGDLSVNNMALQISDKLETDPTTAYQIQGKIVNDLFGSAIEDIKKIQKEVAPQNPPSKSDRPVGPKPTQPRYIPPPQQPRSQAPPVAPGNVVDLRNGNNQ